jgi:hypothetical protein
VAGTSQIGAQLDHRKPAIQGGPAGEILSGSPGAGYGRDRVSPGVTASGLWPAGPSRLKSASWRRLVLTLAARSGPTARFPIAVVGRKCRRARSASAASVARGDMLPNRDIRRLIIDDLMDRCCSQINELRGTRSVYVARMRSDAGCYIGRDATNCFDLIVVRENTWPSANAKS